MRMNEGQGSQDREQSGRDQSPQHPKASEHTDHLKILLIGAKMTDVSTAESLFLSASLFQNKEGILKTIHVQRFLIFLLKLNELPANNKNSLFLAQKRTFGG